MKGLIGQGEIFGGRMESGLMGGGLVRNKPSNNTFQAIAYNLVSMVGGDVVEVILNDEIYMVHSFYSSGELSIQGNYSNVLFDYLIVGGGGGGGYGEGASAGDGAGGGGAGGLIYRTQELIPSPGIYPVVVGMGGLSATKGMDSSLFGLIAYGGGRGGGMRNTGDKDGGSGGGAGGNYAGSNGNGGVGVSGQGNNGGSDTGFADTSGRFGAGGGGAGSVGQTTPGGFPGNGGDGLLIDITGNPLYYAAGGGAGRAQHSSSVGLGGSGIGGNGGNIIGQDAVQYTGSGGGGGGSGGGAGGKGANGIVIIRYKKFY